ncbi:MAG: hypothetical protein RLY67_359 [Pseudomonadota bacterium]
MQRPLASHSTPCRPTRRCANYAEAIALEIRQMARMAWLVSLVRWAGWMGLRYWSLKSTISGAWSENDWALKTVAVWARLAMPGDATR